jgi:hypothetical protein
MKIYYNGKLRTKQGKFSSVRSFFRKLWLYTKITIGACVAGAALVGIGFIMAASNKVEAQNTIIDKTPEKVAQLKKEVVQAISSCEVPNYKAGAAPIILDTNNKMSIGPMMFQVATVQHYEKLLYGKDVTALEATEIALNEQEAKALAEKIMFEDAKGVKNWWNRMNKTQVAPKIEVIKELEK